MGGSCSLLCFIGCILVCKVILCRTVAFGLCKKKCKLHVYLWEVISAFKWLRKRDVETHSNYRCEPMDLDPSPCDQMT